MDLFVDGIPVVRPRTVAERDVARRAVAGFATDSSDLRYLLDVLGLWPKDDLTPARDPRPSWDGGRR